MTDLMRTREGTLVPADFRHRFQSVLSHLARWRGTVSWTCRICFDDAVLQNQVLDVVCIC